MYHLVRWDETKNRSKKTPDVVVENKKKSLDAEQHEETRPEGINERQDSRMLYYHYFYNVVYFENPRI